jgi:hypothetical protein
MSISQRTRPPTTTPDGTGRWFGLAWGALALVPVFFLVGFAVGEGLYAVLGYQPENADAPLWVDLAVLVPTLAVVLIPCAAAVVFGSLARRSGDRRGAVPAVMGLLLGAGWLVLSVVSEVGNLVRR